ncbi:MAG TPA: helix-turn-helix transcriptional regulator [Symbiobacteriaceae bacterium]|nr:helix-turn-helix transcriptional regulator [Symbiobacteriaceae bacterium]
MKQGQSGTPVLGPRLRQLREGHGLVLQDVANLFGTSRNVPSQWEGGQREPSYEHLVKLADFYGVTVDWLLGREGAEQDSARVRQIKSLLHDYLRMREASLVNTTPGERLRTAAEFLVSQDPTMFSLERIAQQLLIMPETLRQMMFGQVMVTGPVVQRFAQFVNLAEVWFYQPSPQLEDPFVKYRTLVEKFQAQGLTPEMVEQQVWGTQRGARRTRKSVEV